MNFKIFKCIDEWWMINDIIDDYNLIISWDFFFIHLNFDEQNYQILMLIKGDNYKVYLNCVQSNLDTSII